VRFFVPETESAAEAEEVYSAIIEFNRVSPQTSRIRRLVYSHNRLEMAAEVGLPVNRYYGEGDQPVMAILKAPGCYLICLPLRGVLRGEPILAGDNSIRQVDYFND
jgi:hypothetical protein